jgi:hypothetical protein
MPDLLGELASGLKRLSTIKKEMDEVSFKEEILHQRSLLLDAKEEILRLREEHTALLSEIKEYQAKSERINELVEVEGFKFDQVNGRPSGLPYCPKCEVSEKGSLYRLKKANERYSECPNCKNSFNVGKDGLVHPPAPSYSHRTGSVF